MGPASSSLRDSRPDQGFSVGDPCICLRPFCESPGLCVAQVTEGVVMEGVVTGAAIYS